MLAAAPESVERITPTPKYRGATCPLCKHDVLAKCGQQVVWHWAHRQAVTCDPWAEPDTDWHRRWQERWPVHQREVVMGPHRADVKVNIGVLELQHSSLSIQQIEQRELFYNARSAGGMMTWLFDAVDAYDQDRLNLRIKPGAPGRVRTFRWKQPRKSILGCGSRVYLDLGDGDVFYLQKMYPNSPTGGLGYRLPVDQFVAKLDGAHRHIGREINDRVAALRRLADVSNHRVNWDLIMAGHPPRAAATTAEMEAIVVTLDEWLAGVKS